MLWVGLGLTVSEIVRQLERAQKGPRMCRAQSWLCLLQAKVELAVFAPRMKDQGTGGFPQTWVLLLEPHAWLQKGNHLEGGVERGLSEF